MQSAPDSTVDLVPSSMGMSENFEVEDCQRTCDQVKSKGVEFKMELRKMPYEIAVVIADPDGNLFEIQAYPNAKC